MARKKQAQDLIFSLDIGTRTVVGIVGKMVEDKFHVIDHEVIPHSKRSMLDGQIEDIDAVSKIVSKVKLNLEKRNGIKFSSVAIAAAGRSLKTERVLAPIEIPTREPISEQLAQSFEMEAISTAQNKIDMQQEKMDEISYYCVGYSIIGYKLDGYAMKSIQGHRGKEIEVEVIAAFLPSMVVESLYAVMEKNKLEVSSLTLEPIAAMNVIVPAEVRLINIALVDIGAGTSDIAISKEGSIVAYAMATIAGDEITEEIIKHYLVDFQTAEEMKISAVLGSVTYKDILGFEYTISAEEFYKTISPAIDALADSITQTITNINGGAPSAIFLVGGGSLIPSLPKIISEKLSIPISRIAVSGSNYIKSVMVSKDELSSPEFVTPIGIGVTSLNDKGYNFSNIFLNDKKFKIFDTKNLKVVDVLFMGGYKTKEILGRKGTDLVFYVNGEEKIVKGEIGIPAQITLNEQPTTLNTFVKKWDKIHITPAISGKLPVVKAFDLVEDGFTVNVVLDGVEYIFEPTIRAENEIVQLDYKVKNNDDITITKNYTLMDLANKSGKSVLDTDFYINSKLINQNYELKTGDVITTIKEEEKQEEKIDITPINKKSKNENASGTPAINIYLNGKTLTLPQKQDKFPHQLLEVLNHIEFDETKPVALQRMTLNGQTADFISVIKDKDIVEIEFTS